MTNGTGGTALVNLSSSTTTPAALSRACRSGSKSTSNSSTDGNHLEDVALVDAEERIMDEEVTSVEDDNLHEESSSIMEHTMISVELVNSITETTDLGDPAMMSEEVDDVDGSGGHEAKARYGLRKRRRPTGQDLERLEHLQSSNEGGLARTNLSAGLATPKVVSTSSPRRRKKLIHDPPSLPPYAIPCTITSVPNPLSHLLPDDPAPLPPTTESSSQLDLSFVVPCPLPACEEQMDTKSLPPPSSAPPIPMEVYSGGDKGRKNVTINDQPPSGSYRIRGFSIDMDLGLDFGEDASAAGASADGGGRDRAFSFECFAFGINADEPLPPLDQPLNAQGSVGGRPRGDSIIFDPSSFQDGGIHEQTALERARSRALSMDISKPVALPPPVIETVSPVHSNKSSTTKSHGRTSAATTIQHPSSPLSVTMPAVAAHASITVPSGGGVTSAISLELVNKDGRIGIYLPEARRARIARFHAKRAKRIWRKRIKYDCRKKLADSRPRVKGRFVKRTDMEED